MLSRDSHPAVKCHISSLTKDTLIGSATMGIYLMTLARDFLLQTPVKLCYNGQLHVFGDLDKYAIFCRVQHVFEQRIHLL